MCCRRNAVFDLKMLREEREEDFELAVGGGGGQKSTNNSRNNQRSQQEFDEEELNGEQDNSRFVFNLDTPPSPVESAVSAYSSGLESERREEALEAEDGADDADRNRFERLLQEKLDMPTSDNGLYLARTVAPVLTRALAEVLLRRPANPIGFISDWLVRYTDEEQAKQVSEL